MSETARETYESNGFVIHQDPVLTNDIVRRSAEGMDAIRRGEYDRGQPPEPSRWNPGDDPNTLCKIEQPQKASRGVFDLVSRPEIGRLAADVTGADWIQVWWVQLLFKPTGEATDAAKVHVGWHQDRNYWGTWEEGSELLTARVALSDVEEDCGPMRFVVGSHRWGYLEGRSDFSGQDLDTIRSQMHVPNGECRTEVPALMRAGGLSLHDCLTIHGSSANTSRRPRRSFAIHLRTGKSRPVDNQRAGLARFVDDPSVCPVIYGSNLRMKKQ